MEPSSHRVSAYYQLIYVLILLLLMVVWASPALAQAHDEALKRRLLQEAPSRWEEYLKKTEMLQGKITYRCLESPSGTDVQVFEYKTNGRGKAITCEVSSRKENKKNGWDREVFAANPRYAFRIRRATSDAPWAVIQLVDLGKESLPREWTLRIDQVFVPDARELVHFQGQRMADIVQRPTFHISRCATVQRDGEELVEVSFAYERDSSPGARAGLYEGTLLLDPNRFWCLRSTDYTVKFKNDNRYRSEIGKRRFIGFAELAGSLAVPKLVESERDFFRDASGKDRLVYHIEYDLDLPRRLPGDEEFTLSAYGLPEPPGLEWKRPTRWYLWLGLAGIACLALGVVVRKVRTRARTSP